MGAGNLEESQTSGISNHRGDSLMLQMLPKAGRGERTLAFPFLLTFSVLPVPPIGQIFPGASWQGSLGDVVCMGHPHFSTEQSREEREMNQSANRQ